METEGAAAAHLSGIDCRGRQALLVTVAHGACAPVCCTGSSTHGLEYLIKEGPGRNTQ